MLNRIIWLFFLDKPNYFCYWISVEILQKCHFNISINLLFRWYLVHWLIFHCFVVLLLFITAILVFVLQESYHKIIGVVPLILIVVITAVWSQVREDRWYLSLWVLTPPPLKSDNHFFGNFWALLEKSVFFHLKIPKHLEDIRNKKNRKW